MPINSPAASRPGLSRSTPKFPEYKPQAGKNRMVPTRRPGKPRAIRKPKPFKSRSFGRRRSLPKIRKPGPVPKLVTKSAPKLAAKAASTGKLAIAKKVAGRALGVFGALSLVADVFDLAAPFVQDWLRGGWRGAEGKLYAPVLVPGEGEVGSGDGLFRIDGTSTTYASNTAQFNGTLFGPIGGYRLDFYTSGSNNCSKIQGFGYGNSGTGRQEPATWYDLSGGQYNGCVGNAIQSYSIGGVTHLGQGSATDGTGPPVEAPNPIYDNALPTSPPEFDVVPSAQPDYVPAVPNPQELLENLRPTVPRPKVPGVISPSAEPSPNAVPAPNPGATPSTPTLPDYSSPEPRPTKPASGSCSGAQDSPCSSATFDYLKYIDDKLDRQKEEEKECPECPEAETISFPYVECEDGVGTLKSGLITLISSDPGNLSALLEEQANLAMAGCGVGESILAIPDSWQQRRPMIVPTIVLVFRVNGTSIYHSYSMPHPASTQPTSSPPVGEFQKGNILGSVGLVDNSRVTVNCSTEAEAERVITEFLSQIDPQFIPPDRVIRLSKRKGVPVSSGQMMPVRALYFPEGRQNLAPSWRRSFTDAV